jgi:hypothetical protein
MTNTRTTNSARPSAGRLSRAPADGRSRCLRYGDPLALLFRLPWVRRLAHIYWQASLPAFNDS